MFKIKLEYLRVDLNYLPNQKLCKYILDTYINHKFNNEDNTFVYDVYEKYVNLKKTYLDIELLRKEVEDEFDKHYTTAVGILLHKEFDALINWLTNQIWEWIISEALDYYNEEGNVIVADAPLKNLGE